MSSILTHTFCYEINKGKMNTKKIHYKIIHEKPGLFMQIYPRKCLKINYYSTIILLVLDVITDIIIH